MTTENATQKPPLPLLILRLRAVVLALGESASPAWWKTEFMNETGLRFLERLYPRTTFHAAVHAAGKAAGDAHDRAVGRVGVYHLFRLPESLETELHRMPPDPADDFFPTLHYTPEDIKDVGAKIAYIKELKALAATSKNADEFKAAVKAKYPEYSGENYLDMTVGFFFA